MSERRYHYEREEAAVRGAWLSTIAPPAATTEDEVRKRALCNAPTAFRVCMLRRAASLAAVELWLDGDLTLRQLERIVLLNPFDETGQVREASAASGSVRRRLQRTA